MNIFRLFQNKKRKKMYENMLQNAPNCTIQNFFSGEACPQTPPLTNAWLRHASQDASRHATRPALQKVHPHWQILHTPMDYY